MSCQSAVAQECCFWRRSLYERAGGVDPSKFYIMDYDLFFRMWRIGHFRKTSAYLGCFRRHEETKNVRHEDVWRRELAEAKDQFGLKDPGYLGIRFLNRMNSLQRFLETRFADQTAPEWPR